MPAFIMKINVGKTNQNTIKGIHNLTFGRIYGIIIFVLHKKI